MRPNQLFLPAALAGMLTSLFRRSAPPKLLPLCRVTLANRFDSVIRYSFQDVVAVRTGSRAPSLVLSCLNKSWLLASVSFILHSMKADKALSEAARKMGMRSVQSRKKMWGEKEFARRMKDYGKLGGRPKRDSQKSEI